MLLGPDLRCKTLHEHPRAKRRLHRSKCSETECRYGRGWRPCRGPWDPADTLHTQPRSATEARTAVRPLTWAVWYQLFLSVLVARRTVLVDIIKVQNQKNTTHETNQMMIAEQSSTQTLFRGLATHEVARATDRLV